MQDAWMGGAAALTVFLGACGPVSREDAERHPNIVLIQIDTLRADRLSSYGCSAETSPELDALAEGGVRFTRVIAPSSWTRPSMGALLTSHYPRTLGIYKEVGHVLPDRFLTLPEVLREAGYRTLGATANPNLNRGFNFAQGFDEYLDSTVLFPWMSPVPDAVSLEEEPLQPARDIFRTLLDRARRRAPEDGRPTYLQAVIMEVHESLSAGSRPEEYAGLFPGAEDARYLQAVRYTSRLVADFVADLRELAGWEDTLFLIISDHGEGLSDHPAIEHRSADTRPIARNHGWLLYESHVMVPWIFFSTTDRLPPATVVADPVRLLDLMPTVLDFAGVPVPDGLRGVSLRGLLEAGEQRPDLPAYFVVETQFRGADKIGVYGADWKYFEYRNPLPGTAWRELQPIGGGDNGAQSDQAAEFPAVIQRMAAFLRRWEASTPRVAPVVRAAPSSAAERGQMSALGYGEDG